MVREDSEIRAARDKRIERNRNARPRRTRPRFRAQEPGQLSRLVKWRNADDTNEGPRVFPEKRPPRWQGK